MYRSNSTSLTPYAIRTLPRRVVTCAEQDRSVQGDAEMTRLDKIPAGGEQISNTDCQGRQPDSTDVVVDVIPSLPVAAAAGACDVISIPAS